jgi:hypothetical protein
MARSAWFCRTRHPLYFSLQAAVAACSLMVSWPALAQSADDAARLSRIERDVGYPEPGGLQGRYAGDASGGVGGRLELIRPILKFACLVLKNRFGI